MDYFFPISSPLRWRVEEEKGDQVVSACSEARDEGAIFSCPVSQRLCVLLSGFQFPPWIRSPNAD